MSDSIDPYKILGVGPDATYEEVRQAYRRAATKYHPDAGGDSWVFQQVQQAFAILRERFENDQTPPRNRTTQESRKNSEAPNSRSTERTQSAKSRHQSASEQTPHSRGEPAEAQPAFGSVLSSLSGTKLELRDETSYFVLANFMDLVMTGILMRFHAIESNPIAAFIHYHFGFAGMVGLKVASVVLVCVLAQVIAKHNRTKGKLLLVAGTLVVSAVVVYSMFLARSLIHFG